MAKTSINVNHTVRPVTNLYYIVYITVTGSGPSIHSSRSSSRPASVSTLTIRQTSTNVFDIGSLDEPVDRPDK